MKKILSLIVLILIGHQQCKAAFEPQELYVDTSLNFHDLKEFGKEILGEDFVKKTEDFFTVTTDTSNPNWLFFEPKNRQPLTMQEKESEFFAFPLLDWGKNYQLGSMPAWNKKIKKLPELQKNLMDLLYYCAFMDPTNNVSFQDIENQKMKDEFFNMSVLNLFAKKYGQKKTFVEQHFLREGVSIPDDKKILKQLKTEALEAMSYTYKIHLQIAEQYFISFVIDLTQLFMQDQRFQSVQLFKVVRNYTKEHLRQDGFAIPVIVLYVDFLTGPLEERNAIIEDIFMALLERYGSVSKQISLGVAPRFNYKVNDLIWIAGGNGNEKEMYKAFIEKVRKTKKRPNLPNTVYSSDWHFIRGYEYKKSEKLQQLLNKAEDPQEPQEQVIDQDSLSKLQLALENFKKVAQSLRQELEVFEETQGVTGQDNPQNIQ